LRIFTKLHHIDPEDDPATGDQMSHDAGVSQMGAVSNSHANRTNSVAFCRVFFHLLTAVSEPEDLIRDNASGMSQGQGSCKVLEEHHKKNKRMRPPHSGLGGK
jgi:hypothetical protein